MKFPKVICDGLTGQSNLFDMIYPICILIGSYLSLRILILIKDFKMKKYEKR